MVIVTSAIIDAEIDAMIHSAYFISTIVDMERLILNMMSRVNVTGKELEKKGVIQLHLITAFAKTHGAVLIVMEGGEHWFHTDEQMRFLDNRNINGRSIR